MILSDMISSPRIFDENQYIERHLNCCIIHVSLTQWMGSEGPIIRNRYGRLWGKGRLLVSRRILENCLSNLRIKFNWIFCRDVIQRVTHFVIPFVFELSFIFSSFSPNVHSLNEKIQSSLIRYDKNTWSILSPLFLRNSMIRLQSFEKQKRPFNYEFVLNLKSKRNFKRQIQIHAQNLVHKYQPNSKTETQVQTFALNPDSKYMVKARNIVQNQTQIFQIYCCIAYLIAFSNPSTCLESNDHMDIIRLPTMTDVKRRAYEIIGVRRAKDLSVVWLLFLVKPINFIHSVRAKRNQRQWGLFVFRSDWSTLNFELVCSSLI